MTRIKAACCSIQGDVRKNNEDNFYFDGSIMPEKHIGSDGILTAAKDKLTLAVFDGLGGENCGETASFLAAEALRAFADSDGSDETGCCRLTNNMNERIRAFMDENRISSMGTTVAGMFIDGNDVTCFTMGDSRVYRFRNGEIRQLSTDHAITRPGHLRRSLVSFLGAFDKNDPVAPDCIKDMAEQGDIYLLCTDGLTDMLKDREIARILAENDEVDICLRELIAKVERKGAIDNTTIITAKVI